MRLGIIGNGDSARSFAGASHFADGVELVGMAGRNLERVGAVADKHGVEAMTIDDLLAKDIDCLAVTTPPGLHGQHALPFIRKGVHVMIEKPMALAVEDCDKLIEEADKAGVTLTVTQTYRYTACGRKAREVVGSGKYGPVVSVYVYCGQNYFTEKRSGWQINPELSGGGITFNTFIHMIDYARYMAMSEVKEFHGGIGYHKEGFEIEGDAHCLVVFENGAKGSVHVDGYNHAHEHRVEVSMEKAMMSVLPLEKRIEIKMGGGRVAEAFGFGENGIRNEEGFYANCGYIGHLVEMRQAVEGGGPITSDGPNGRANVVIARSILESSGVSLPGPTI